MKARDQQHGNSVQRLHQIESARDKLLSDGDNALGEILSAWPSAEPALLRQWHRQYPREVKKGNERAHRRKLFRYLAGLDEEDALIRGFSLHEVQPPQAADDDGLRGRMVQSLGRSV